MKRRHAAHKLQRKLLYQINHVTLRQQWMWLDVPDQQTNFIHCT